MISPRCISMTGSLKQEKLANSGRHKKSPATYHTKQTQRHSNPHGMSIKVFPGKLESRNNNGIYIILIQFALPGHKRHFTCLLGFSKTNGIIAKVINAIPSPEEGVSENSKGTNGLGKIHAHKSADAITLHVQNIVIWADGEAVATKVEGKVGKTITFRAINGVLAAPRLCSTNLLVTTSG
jgi:hypothetical protein